jgi:hypothetical protein
VRQRTVALLVASLFIATVVLAHASGVLVSGVACGDRVVVVRGRLVDAETRRPITDAWLLTLACKAWADDSKTIEDYRTWNREKEAAIASSRRESASPLAFVRAELNAAATTDADGRFEAWVSVPCSSTLHMGRWREVSPPFERVGVEAIRVERPERRAVTVAVSGGVWDESDRGPGKRRDWDLPDAVWNLGDVIVPPK